MKYEEGERELEFPVAIVDKSFIQAYLGIVDSQTDIKLDVCFVSGTEHIDRLNDATSDDILKTLDSYEKADKTLENISIIARKNKTGIDLKWLYLEANASGLSIGISARYEPESVAWVEDISNQMENIVRKRSRFIRVVHSEWSFGISTWLLAILSLALTVITLASSSVPVPLTWALASLAILFLILSVSLFFYQRASKGGTIISPKGKYQHPTWGRQ